MTDIDSIVKKDYKKSINMWNEVYSKCKIIDLSKKQLSVEPTFDICLDLFASECKTVLDYGCGTGDVLFQVYQFGNLEEGLGIDLSESGIKYAVNECRVSNYNSLQFAVGGLDLCKKLGDESYDGIILSNVLDVVPKDICVKIYIELTRVLKKGGLMLIKLNPYYSKEELNEFGYINLKDNLYEEDEVLRFREIHTSQWKEMFYERYNIERYLEFPYPWQEGQNRLFLLKKK